MRKAFTLIEMLIAITILSIMMLFLYKSYASLNNSNKFYKQEVDSIKTTQLKKRVMFLDFSLALLNKTTILNQDVKGDVVFLQSSNSLYQRFNPYIAYLVKDSKLYRLESSKEFRAYPIERENEFVAECLGDVNSFRVYKSKADKETYLIHVDFKDEEAVILKVKVLSD